MREAHVELAVRVLQVGSCSGSGACHHDIQHTWLRKWHSLADLATTSEEKMQETRMMLSAKYKGAIFRVQALHCNCK